MNLDNLRQALLAAARKHTPSDKMPYAFERRIMLRIKGIGMVDYWAAWSQALWRAAAPCVALALLLAALSVLVGPGSPATSGSDISQDFENTVLAAATLDQPAPELPR